MARPKPNIDAVSQRVGENVARLRSDAGRRQEDLAAAARRTGLSWTRSTVAAIETGRREIGLHELFLLPLVFVEACDVDPTLADFLRGSEALTLTGRVSLPATYARRMLTGEPGRGYRYTLTATESSAVEATADVHLDLLNEVPSKRREEAWQSSKGEAERKAAGRLGVPAGVIGPAAYVLWKRSLTDERDRRVEAAANPGDSQRTYQARRGHVTRALLAELRALLVDRGAIDPTEGDTS